MTWRGVAKTAVTLAVVAAAAAVGWQAWKDYTLSPWTRDARVLANVSHVAPDVAGLISAVHVRDNQDVEKGDLLFEIDPERYRAELELAHASVAMYVADLAFANENAERYRRLQRIGSPGFSLEASQRMETLAAEAEASLGEARSRLAIAEINMRRSQVHAPVSGHVTNLTAVPGDYAQEGEAILALVEAGSFYVYGYFMETKLPLVRKGAPAQVRLMAGGDVLEGKVQGVARAIANPDDARGVLANVDPDFSWIRLAQRIPVRIELTNVPDDLHLASGMSATVFVQPETP